MRHFQAFPLATTENLETKKKHIPKYINSSEWLIHERNFSIGFMLNSEKVVFISLFHSMKVNLVRYILVEHGTVNSKIKLMSNAYTTTKKYGKIFKVAHKILRDYT